MKLPAVFNVKRFPILLRQHLLHNYWALLLGLLVAFGISFLIIALLQYLGPNNQIRNNQYFIIFLFGYVLLGAFYISSAFSSFRNKEKALAYLMVPGSTSEKFLVEIIFYPLLYLLAFPVLYIVSYHLSSLFITMVIPGFVPFNLLGAIREFFVQEVTTFNGEESTTYKQHFWALIASISFTVAMAFFLGAVSFKKYAMLKTLLGLATYIGICVWMMYWLMNELEWGNYNPPDDIYLSPLGTESITGQSVINFVSICIFCWGLIFTLVSYLKLKEKEV